MVRRFLRGAVLLGIVLVPFLTACGGSGSSGAADRPGISASLSPTRERPTATRTPDTPGDSSAVGPTSAPTSAPRTSRLPATSGPASPTESSSSPAPAESNTEEGSSDSTGWWWLALVVLLVGAVVAVLLVRRSRRGRTWRSDVASAEREVGWFARDLIPQLRGSGSVAGVTGGWTVAAPRVSALDDRLTHLVTTAPGEEERARATALRDAVRTARDRIAALVTAGGSVTWSLDLDGAQAPLLAVLVPPDAGSPG